MSEVLKTVDEKEEVVVERNDKVVFEVGNEKYKVESSKSFLSKHSSVFNSMFFGELKEKCEVIQIPDCKPEVFEYLLKYPDGNNLDFVKLDVGHSLYIAEKYMLTGLKGALIVYATENLNYENFINIYQASILLDIKDLQASAFAWLCLKAEDVLRLDSLLDAPEECLLSLLSNDLFHKIKELKIFQFVKTWIRLNKKPESKLLSAIKLSRMSFTEIDTFVRPTKLFSFEKLYQALLELLNENSQCERLKQQRELEKSVGQKPETRAICQLSNLKNEFSFNSEGFMLLSKSKEMVFDLGDIFELREIVFQVGSYKIGASNYIDSSEYDFVVALSSDEKSWSLLDSRKWNEKASGFIAEPCLYYSYSLNFDKARFIKFAFFVKSAEKRYVFKNLNYSKKVHT